MSRCPSPAAKRRCACACGGTPAQGNLHAKTGTTNDVVALSGYVSARTGEIIAFSFLYNGKDRWNARATIDAMGVTLADFARIRLLWPLA